MIDEIHMKKHPPQLRQISQCTTALDFLPQASWPESLPAVAINGYLIAGFKQSLVFDHTLDWEDQEAVSGLFRSLYFELSTCEFARLWKASRHVPQFSLPSIFAKFQIRWNSNTEKLCEIISKLPLEFQNYCSEKKWSFGDFQPLAASQGLILSPFFLRIVEMNMSRSQSVLALELVVDLLLMGKSPVEILPQDQLNSGESWIETLRLLRYPQTSQKDDWASRQVEQLPWPGTAQAKWTRQGDRAGIELKLFVSNPTDFKKYLQSLSVVQEALEKEGPWKKH
jgi:hypothetical protein